MEQKKNIVFIGNNLPRLVALKDISEYMRQEKMNQIDEHGDIWNVTPSQMDNKHVRKMNFELGVHKVNKFGERMGKKRD